MNKVFLKGRLTRDPEIRYSKGTPPLAIARYTLAVNRKLKRDNEPEADFFNVIAFGKAAELADKYFEKGMLIIVIGHLQTGNYEKNGIKHYTTDIIAEEQEFAESKKSGQTERPPTQSSIPPEGFVPVDEDFDDDIPF